MLSEADGARDDVRRLRRGLRRLARRGRRRARRRFGDAASGDEELDDEDEAVAEPGTAPERGPAAPSPADRVEAALREAGAQDRVFRPRGAELPFADVLGWQPLLLNAAAPCACGERQLAAGEEAFVAVTERGLSRTFLCRTCMRARGTA
jgi:hypothetical protein